MAFQNYLLTQNPDINTEIVTTAKVSSTTRLEIYRDAYYLRLLEVLEQDYEVLRTVLGTDSFDQLGRDYIDAYPSQFRSVRWFGKYMPDHMKNYPLFKNQPHLIEMAEFEWLLTESFDAKDIPVVTIEQMTTVEPEKWPDLCFKLHPSVRRLDLFWNIVSIWNSVKAKEAIPEPQKTEKPVNWIIWRKEKDTPFNSLSPDKAYMLDSFANNENFGTVCEGLCTWMDEADVGLHAALLLKQFILDHLITEIIVC